MGTVSRSVLGYVPACPSRSLCPGPLGQVAAAWSGHLSLETGAGCCADPARSGVLGSADWEYRSRQHPALLHKCFNEATGSLELIALAYTVSPSVTLCEALSWADTV